MKQIAQNMQDENIQIRASRAGKAVNTINLNKICKNMPSNEQGIQIRRRTNGNCREFAKSEWSRIIEPYRRVHCTFYSSSIIGSGCISTRAFFATVPISRWSAETKSVSAIFSI